MKFEFISNACGIFYGSKKTKILCDPQTSGGLLVFVDPKGTKIVKSILEEYELVSSPIGHLEKYTKNNIYIEVCP